MKTKSKMIVYCIILICVLFVVVVTPVIAFEMSDVPEIINNLTSDADSMQKDWTNIHILEDYMINTCEKLIVDSEELIDFEEHAKNQILYKEGEKLASDGWKNHLLVNDVQHEEWMLESYPNIYILDLINYYFSKIYFSTLDENVYKYKNWDHFGRLLGILCECNYYMYLGMNNGLRSMIKYKFENEDDSDIMRNTAKWYVVFIQKSLIEKFEGFLYFIYWNSSDNYNFPYSNFRNLLTSCDRDMEEGINEGRYNDYRDKENGLYPPLLRQCKSNIKMIGVDLL